MPPLDLALAQQVVDGTLALIRSGLTDTAHDCAEGGLAVALAEMAIAGGLGLKVSLDAPEGTRADALLFGEAHSRVIVAVGDEAAARACLTELGVPHVTLGETHERPEVTIAAPAQHVHLSVNLETLRTAWEEPLKGIVG